MYRVTQSDKDGKWRVWIAKRKNCDGQPIWLNLSHPYSNIRLGPFDTDDQAIAAAENVIDEMSVQQ